MSKKGLWLVACGLWSGVLLAAEVFGRAMGWGAWGPGQRDSGRVAITFDDGPSGRTPQLLEILEKHQAKATFFVTEPACRAHPDWLQALRAAGHQIESHGRWHTHALLLTPWREWSQLRWHPRAAEPGPHLYRPPYGGHSPFTRLLAHLLGRQIALWDVEGRDWTGESAADLAGQTLARMQAGSVILLHDGPEGTPELLDRLLTGVHQRGLRAVTLTHLPMQPISLANGFQRLRQSYGG